MKKLTLEYEQPSTWFTLGLSCQLHDYKLAFRLNKQLSFKFNRLEPFKIDIQKFTGEFSVYHTFDSETQSDIFLLANQSEGRILLQEFKQLDYLIVLREENIEGFLDHIKTQIKKISEVLFIQSIDIEVVKNHSLLIEEFELYLDKHLPK